MIFPILSVKDVEASLAFYTERLEFKQVMTMNGPDDSVVFGIAQFAGADVAFTRNTEVRPGERSAPGVEFMFYVADDEDFDAYFQRVKIGGAPVQAEPTTAYWGDRTFSLTDPDGYAVTMAKTVQQVAVEDMEAHLRSQNA